ncbi:sodium/glucose cotransporter 4-like isoform X2 [Eriocheir sinensis]|uniref:sodium/glucose cotransporter 4-like isoform X2 n=1 Tax=Eriocheir sinensis TaxID=95602 RepID=UPI0021C7A34A|nr:sodium/glucose cotransporter 4-like isoform X2 [Eriocheir sinensis]
MSGYFLASRSMHWIPVGASLFASNIGSGHFIGLAGSGAASGIGIGAFELNAVFVLMMLGWLFVPVYMTSGVFTMPEYLRERFGGQRIRVYLSCLALLLSVFTKISADLYAGALFIQQAIGKTTDEWLYISILILLAIAAVFTISGGLTAVIWTDFVQTILMLFGALTLMGIAFNEVGGYEAMVEDFFYAIPNKTRFSEDGTVNCGEPPSYSMHFFRSAKPGESDLPWPGMLFGITISGIWYWCTDQVIVQRTLSSKNMTYAKAGCVLAGTLKFLPLFMLVFPGMASRILFTDEVACVDPDECEKYCNNRAGCTNIAYVELVLQLLPTGLSGLMLAVMLAALMSSLTSIFNSSSTIFSIDIWTRIRKQATDVELLIVGRGFVLIMVVISILWIPIIQSSASGQLFIYIQSISSFLSPPICAIYLLAIFWPRTTEPGAFWGLIVGLVIGLIRFVMEFAYTIPACGEPESADKRPEWIKVIVGNVHYLHFGCILLLLTMVVTVAVSLLTEPIPEKCLYRLTFWSRNSKEVRVSVREWRNEMAPDDQVKILPKKEDGDASSISTSGSKDLPDWRRALNWMCGVSPQAEGATEDPDLELTPEEKAKRAAEFLEEKAPWKSVVNVLSVIVMVGATFMFGFYG